MQRLALFDLDGTLVDREAAFRAWAEEFVGTHRLDGDALSRLLAADAEFAGPRGPFFVAVREAFGLGRTADELWRQYRGRMPELVSCRTRDLEALRLLRVAGWTIGIVTNGMTDNQQGKIHRAGLAPLVDAWCISEEAGHRKPGPAIFALAALRCGTSITRGGWMTGDDPVLDIAGGRQAGLRTIWLSAGSTAWPGGGPGPDHTAVTVADAVTVLLREPPWPAIAGRPSREGAGPAEVKPGKGRGPAEGAPGKGRGVPGEGGGPSWERAGETNEAGPGRRGETAPLAGGRAGWGGVIMARWLWCALTSPPRPWPSVPR